MFRSIACVLKKIMCSCQACGMAVSFSVHAMITWLFLVMSSCVLLASSATNDLELHVVICY